MTMMPRSLRLLLYAAAVLAAALPASAQSLGTFRWQLQPYCNVVTVNVTGTAGVYTLEGYDDQCGAPTRAPLTGVATPNPDGTIGFGFTVVTSPGGRGVQVEARVATAGLSGPWTDSDGHTGAFAFNAQTGGSPRPLPPPAPPVIPPAISLRADGGFLAGGDRDVGVIPASGPGTRMMWYPRKSAFRAGTAGTGDWDDVNIGTYSAALGFVVRAPGLAAFAAGHGTSASGDWSVALGYNSEARASHGIAAGVAALANGRTSVAIGGEITPQGGIRGVLASGESALALGVGHDAGGRGSVALGTGGSTTFAATGSFVYGDRSTVNQIVSFFPNEFKVRAAGGSFFYSNSLLTSGVVLGAGANAWSSLSDVNSKENFRDLDGAELLGKLTAMPIREWNYRSQDAAIRHVGPTAQDFHAAFGLGEDPLRISTLDADGIALAGVRALAIENAALRAELASLRADLARIERGVNRR